MATTELKDLLPIDLQTFGIRQREFCNEQQPLTPVIGSTASPFLMTPDGNGDYTLLEGILTSTAYMEVYDSDQLILKWGYDGVRKSLVIEVFTEKQVNLLDDLTLNECFVKAKGALFFNGSIQIKHQLVIEADALWFAKPVTSEGRIQLQSQQGQGFAAPVKSQDLIINAAQVYQGSDFDVSGQLDLSALTFKQEANCSTNAHNLRLITLQCELLGNSSSPSCFLTAASLSFGSHNAASNIHFPHKNHIHAGSLMITGDTQICFGNKEEDSGTLNVDNHLLIDRLAMVDVYNMAITVSSIDNQGELNAVHCGLAADTISQQRIFNFAHSQGIIYKTFIHEKHSVTTLIHNNFKCRSLKTYGGQFTIENSTYQGQTCDLYSGLIQIRQDSKLILNSLIINSQSKALIHDSLLRVNEFIHMIGETEFINSQIKAHHIQGSHHPARFENTQVSSSNRLKLRKNLILINSRLKGKFVSLQGEFHTNDAAIHSNHLNLTIKSGKMLSLSIDTDSLSLQGSDKPDAVHFQHCYLITKKISAAGYLAFSTSLIYGIDKNKLTHELGSKTSFKNTKFLTQSQLSQHPNSTLSLSQFSTLRVGLLHSQGAMKAKNSNVFCKAVIQKKAKLKLEESTLHVEEEVFSHASRLTLKDHSAIISSQMVFKERSELAASDSTVAARDKIHSASDSSIKAHQSTIATRKLIALSQAALSSSLLSAEELFIYNEFDVKKQSVLSIDKLMAIAKEGQVKLYNSFAKTNTMSLFGRAEIKDSSMFAENKLAVWSEGALTLNGRTTAQAHNLVVRGDVCVTKNPDKHSPGVQLSANTLNITEIGTVTGDGDLALEAEKFTQSGEINLSAGLRAKGTELVNFGTIKADNVYFGYDDAVINLGCVSAKNLMIHSNVFNVFGEIYAKQSYSCTGFVGANLGMVAANNYSNSNLYSFNSGITLPNFSADYRYIFSAQNLKSGVKTAATMCVPRFANTINLLASVPHLAATASSLHERAQNTSWETLTTMRRHEWMPLACQVKNAASFGFGSLKRTTSIPGEFTSFGADLLNPNTYTFDQLKSGFASIPWSQTGFNCAALFMPSYTDTSLLHFNTGFNLAACASKSNYFHLNTGIESALLTQTVNTHTLANYGWSGAYDATYVMHTGTNAGTLQGGHQFTLKANKLNNQSSGNIDGEHANVCIGKLSQEGRMALRNGMAKIDDFKDGQHAQTDLENLMAVGASLELNNHLKAKNVQFLYSDKFVTSEESQFNSDNCYIETETFIENGQLNYQNALTVVADKAILGEHSTVNGAKTAEEDLFVKKETSEENQSATDSVQPQSEEASEKNPAEQKSNASEKQSETAAETKSEPQQGEKAKEQNPSEQANSDAEKTDTTEEKESEKEFKPQHVFIVHAKKAKLQGKLRGGDYTQIQGIQDDAGEANDEKVENAGPAKCEAITISDTADIDLQYGAIYGHKADVDGLIKLNGFHVELDETNISDDACFQLEKSALKGESLSSKGKLQLDHSVITVESTHLDKNAAEILNNSSITTKKLNDESQLFYQGQAALLTEQYTHTGSIHNLDASTETDDKNLLYVKADQAVLKGSGALDNAYYHIEHFKDAEQFVTGTGAYAQYRTTDSLMFETADRMDLNHAIHRNCDLTVKASAINMNVDYHKAHTLGFISTQGDVNLKSNITANNLYVESAGNIWNNRTIYTHGVTSFNAKGNYYNLGGTVNADVVSVKAKAIINVTPESSVVQKKGGRRQNASFFSNSGYNNFWNKGRQQSQDEVQFEAWGKPVGNAGIINGRNATYLEATEGNIENHGGIIRGGEYTQLIAKGNVVNNCNVVTKGAFGMQTYDGGLIAGGNGTDTDGIGLYIKADGKIISDASDFVSNGSNYLEAKHGFDLQARQHTYISDYSTTKKWYGKKETHMTTSTMVKGSMIHSANGVNTLRSEEGGVHSIATRFSSPGGTNVYARDDVKLYSLKSEDHVVNSQSSLWGLSSKSSHETHQSATPTLFVDNGVTRITSTEGSVDARGAYFIGEGDLSIKAQKRIQFGVDILEHELTEKSRSIGFSGPGMNAYNAWNQGGSAWDVATAEDATLAKLAGVLESNNGTELLANSANLGINLYNTTNSVMRGLASSGLENELLARYGLGGAYGFSPAFTLSMTESQSRATYQTLAQGGVDRGGNIVLEAGEGIDLENGVRVHAGGHMDVNAPEIIAKAAALHSTSEQTTASQSVSLSLTGQVQDASISYSKSGSQATHYVNAELSANGNMRLHCQDKAMSLVELDGANIVAGSLDADIDKLIIKDKQDEMSTKTESASVSLSGQISAYKGQGEAKFVSEHSGIHVTDGINTNGHSVHIGEAYMTGGAITSDGENRIQIDKLVAEQLQDEEHYSGVGLSLNLNDLNRLREQNPTNIAGEQAIAVAEVNVDKVHYQAEHSSVVYGERGTYADIKEQIGDLHTTSADGTHIVKDKSLHLTVDVPMTNGNYLAASQQNIQAGVEKIQAALGDSKAPEDEKNTLQEKALPRKREEEEEEEEENHSKSEDLKDIEDKNKSFDEDSEKDKLSPDELALFLGEALKELQFDSLEEQKAYVAILDEIINNTDEEAKKSPELRQELSNKLKSALLKTLKAGSEDSWGKFIHALGPEYAHKLTELLSQPDALSKLSVKAYTGSKGLLLTFTFNLSLASLDNKADLIKEGINATAADVTFGAILKATTGSLAGPAGWGFAFLGILDDMTYSKDRVDRLFKEGLSTMQEAKQLYTESKWFSGMAAQHQASLQMQSAARMQAYHDVINVSEKIKQGYESFWEKKTQPIEPPVTPENKRHRFFSPEEKQKNDSSKKYEGSNLDPRP